MPDDTMNGDGDATTMGDDSMDMEEAQESPQEEQQEDDKPSIFIPKSCLPEGKKYKVGDTIELTVEDVDPETGEVQACLYDEEANKTSGGRMGYLDAFDKAMPEES